MRYSIKLLAILSLLLLLGCGPTDEDFPSGADITVTAAAPDDSVDAATEVATIAPTAALETEGGMSEAAENTQSPEQMELIASIAPEGTEISNTLPSRDHDEEIIYPFGGNPPIGGTHHPIWYQCGVYYAPLFTQAAIHAMEHGAVWITYNPETIVGPAVTSLAAYASDEPFLLVSPYPEQESPVAVTAWGVQLLLDDVGDERIQQFIDAFANGPQNPEPGADCSRGVTDTMESQ